MNPLHHGQAFVNVHIGEGTVAGADNTVGFAFQQLFHRQIAHLSGVYTVTAGGNTTALNVTQNGNTGIQIDGILNLLGNIRSGTGAFCNYNHVVGKAVEPGLTDFLNHIPFKVNRLLRNQNSRCAYCKAHIHSQEACITAHHLNNRAALMGLHGISQLIDTLNGGVGCSVEADGVVGAADVVINGSRDADHIDAVFGKGKCTPESTVTANGHNAVQTQEMAGGNRSFLAFFRHKFLTAGGIENSAAPIDDMGYLGLIQSNDVTRNKAVPATANTVALNAMIQSSTYDSTDTGVHARCVAAAGQNSDSFNAHNDPSTR